jgi:flagellar protein FliO/FliZ
LPGRPQPETSARQRDNLAALADELSTRGSPPQRSRGNSSEPPRQEQRQETRLDARQETREQRAEPRLEPRKPLQPAASVPSPSPSVTATPAVETPATADQSLADMAQRLEAALRKSPGEARPGGGQPRATAAADQTAHSEALPTPPPRPAPPGEQKPLAAEASKANQNKTAIYDTLEQEMANLLGRPSKS